MIIALDSATPPTAAQALAARAAGVRLWNGHLATRPGVGLLRTWTQAEFDAARLCGGTPIAYCSGWDDPAAVRQLAAAWNVRPCLDVESGIRGDGPWVQSWLDAAGAGLYGNLGVHGGRRAAFHVLSWYTADPRATWGASAPPGTPCGWQWQNSHDEFGVTVDRCYFDDWFDNEEEPMQYATKQAFVRLAYLAACGREPESQDALNAWANGIHDNGDNVDSIVEQIGDSPEGRAWREKLKGLSAGTPPAIDIAALAAQVAAHLKVQAQ